MSTDGETTTFILSPNADYFHDPRRIAIEDRLVALRDGQMSVLNRGNGAVIREKDGSPSSAIRMGMDDVLRLADQHDPVRAAVAKALAFLNGETERVTACGKHPEGHAQKVGAQTAEDLDYLRQILSGGEQ